MGICPSFRRPVLDPSYVADALKDYRMVGYLFYLLLIYIEFLRAAIHSKLYSTLSTFHLLTLHFACLGSRDNGSSLGLVDHAFIGNAA